MTRIDSFWFVSNAKTLSFENAYVARINEEIGGVKSLLEVLSKTLNLPAYFGFNWNALSECLRDLHWIEEKKVFIVHEYLPKLSANEMTNYLEVLHEAVIDWKPGDEHALEIVFEESKRNYIRSLI